MPGARTLDHDSLEARATHSVGNKACPPVSCGLWGCKAKKDRPDAPRGEVPSGSQPVHLLTSTLLSIKYEHKYMSTAVRMLDTRARDGRPLSLVPIQG